MIVAATLGVVVLVAAATIGGVTLLRTDDTSTTTTSTTTTTTTSTTTTTATTTTAAPVSAALGDVRSQPPGLFCRDLRAKGFSYSAAVDYWRNNGQPDQMDADRNGIPCETVYPRSDVIAYWGATGVTPTYSTANVYDLPPGLLCRDLKARGFDVYDAIAYYLNWGSPSDMDADHNGIPCETVYPNAADAWNSGGD